MNRFSRFSIAISLSVLAIISCRSASREFVPPVAFDAGLAKLDHFEFAAADSLFTTLSQADSTAGWGNYGLGLSEQLRLNRWMAVERYYLALKAEPDFAPAMIGLGRICSELNWPGEAIKMYKSALAMGGDNNEIQALLALELLKFYEYDQATQAASEVAGSGSFGDWIEASAELAQGNASSSSGAVDRARANSKSRMDYRAAASFFDLAGQTDSSAVYSYKLAEAEGWSSVAVMENFRQSLKRSDFQAARQAMNRLPENESTASLSGRMKIDYHLARSEAVGAFLNFRDYLPRMEGTLDALVTTFHVKSNLADAFSCERVLVEIDGMLESGLYTTGLVRLARLYTIALHPEIRMAKQAVGRLEKQRQPGQTDDYPFDQIELYLALCAGDFDRYDKLEADFLDRYGRSAANLTRHADLTANEFAFAEKRALEFYPLVLEKSGGFLPAFEGWIELLMRSRKFDEAVAAFENYPHFAEQFPLLAGRYAVCLAETDQVDRAIEIFRPAMAELTVRTDLIDLFLRSLWKFDRTDLGQAICEEYLSLASDNPEVLSLVAEWFCEFGQYDRALELATRATTMPLATPSAEIQRARAMSLTGKKQAATNLFIKLLDAQDSNPELGLFYSELLAMDKKNPRQAGNLARSSLVKSRHTIKALMNISFVYSQQKRYDLALGQMKQAIRQYPDHPRLFYAMGQAAYHEKKDEYKGAFEQAISLGLAGDDLLEAKRILGK